MMNSQRSRQSNTRVNQLANGVMSPDTSPSIHLQDYNAIQLMSQEERQQWLDTLTVERALAEDWNLRNLDLVLNTHKFKNLQLRDCLAELRVGIEENFKELADIERAIEMKRRLVEKKAQSIKKQQAAMKGQRKQIEVKQSLRNVFEDDGGSFYLDGTNGIVMINQPNPD